MHRVWNDLLGTSVCDVFFVLVHVVLVLCLEALRENPVLRVLRRQVGRGHHSRDDWPGRWRPCDALPCYEGWIPRASFKHDVLLIVPAVCHLVRRYLVAAGRGPTRR